MEGLFIRDRHEGDGVAFVVSFRGRDLFVTYDISIIRALEEIAPGRVCFVNDDQFSVKV